MPMNLDLKLDSNGVPQEPSWMAGHVRLTAIQWERLVKTIVDNKRELTRKRKLWNAKRFIVEKVATVKGVTSAMVMDDNVFAEACKLAGVEKEFAK